VGCHRLGTGIQRCDHDLVVAQTIGNLLLAPMRSSTASSSTASSVASSVASLQRRRLSAAPHGDGGRSSPDERVDRVLLRVQPPAVAHPDCQQKHAH